MTKAITAALLFALSGATGCIAYAHPPNHRPPVEGIQAHQVRAWVWVEGRWERNNVWIRGYWEVRTINRTLLSSHPRTHIRWVEGRQRPVPPNHRHRRRR